MELQLVHKISIVQNNLGSKFKCLTFFLTHSGIIHQTFSHEENGMIERKHRHVVDIGHSMLNHASMSIQHWDEAFYLSNFLINRLPKSPFVK